jgi:hypothetical protein
LHCHFFRHVKGRFIENHQRPWQHNIDVAAGSNLADDDRESLLNLTQRLLGQLFQISRAITENALTIGDLVLQRTFACAQLVRRQRAPFITKALLFIPPALLLVLNILIQFGAAAFNFLAHLTESSGDPLNFRHINHADHGGGRWRTWWKLSRGWRGLGGPLRCGLRWALTLLLRLSLGLARDKPARLVLRRRHDGKGQ